jgi:hypothetical protein
MGKITREELSSSLDDHINNQGNDKQDEIDSNLQTSDKTIVGAINELYQNINDGKALIANAIGEPLTDEDSFTTMSNGINSLTSLLKTNLTNAGVDVNDEEKLKSLISKVKGIVKENTSKGIKFAEGTGSWTVSSSVTISSPDLDFTPDIIICHFESLTQTRYYYGNHTAENTTSYRTYITNTSPLINTYNSASKLYISDIELGSFKLKMDSLNENNSYGNYWYISGKCIGWYAIGLDEKDTTLRDLLASILQDEGVTVTEEDNMASLIRKVDEEFDSNKQQLEAILSAKNIEIEKNASLKDLIYKVTNIKQYSMTHGTVWTLGTAADMTVNDYLSTTWVSTTVVTIPSVLELPFTGLTVSFQMYCNFSYNSTVVINLVRNSETIQLYNGSLAGSPSFPSFSLNVTYNFEPGDTIVLTSPGMNKTGNNSPRHIFYGIKATCNIKGL